MCLLKILALLLLVIIMTKSLSLFYFLLDFEYFKSMISSLNPIIVSNVERVLLSTCVIFCSADTIKNYFPFDKGKILSTPTSTVLISLLISSFLSLRSTFKTPVYSPPKIKRPLSR